MAVMKRKNKQVENRLRSNEAKDILLTVIQKDALQNMSWLTEDTALDAEDQKEKAREIKIQPTVEKILPGNVSIKSRLHFFLAQGLNL
jgi:hypothetical protein